jgi:hypothetical protein
VAAFVHSACANPDVPKCFKSEDDPLQRSPIASKALSDARLRAAWCAHDGVQCDFRATTEPNGAVNIAVESWTTAQQKLQCPYPPGAVSIFRYSANGVFERSLPGE